MLIDVRPLYLDPGRFRVLLERLGPSLGLWRSAEVAALREERLARPVLDLGCGDGTVTSLVIDRVDIGLDPWPEAFAAARACGLYDRVEAATAATCSLEPGSVATVLANSVLEHVEDIDGALRDVARLLRPGGRLLVTAPTEALGAWLAVPARAYARRRNRAMLHHHLWPLGEWQRRLARAGLTIERVRPYLRRPLVAIWDAVDNAERVRVGRLRPAGLLWRRLSASRITRLAQRGARLDLSAPHPGGGRLLIARRRA